MYSDTCSSKDITIFLGPWFKAHCWPYYSLVDFLLFLYPIFHFPLIHIKSAYYKKRKILQPIQVAFAVTWLFAPGRVLPDHSTSPRSPTTVFTNCCLTSPRCNLRIGKLEKYKIQVETWTLYPVYPNASLWNPPPAIIVFILWRTFMFKALEVSKDSRFIKQLKLKLFVILKAIWVQLNYK